MLLFLAGTCFAQFGFEPRAQPEVDYLPISNNLSVDAHYTSVDDQGMGGLSGHANYGLGPRTLAFAEVSVAKGDANFANMIAWGQPARGEAIRGRVTHINDSATTFGKEGERRLRGQKGGGAGAMETGEPIFRTCAKERGRAIGSRIVDEEIESTEAMANLAKEAVDRIGEGEIGWNHQGGGT